MEQIILEPTDSPQESNVPEKEEVSEQAAEPVEGQGQPKAFAEGSKSEDVPPEEGKEVEGQRYTAAQLKEMEEAFKNKQEWQKANTQKAQQLAEERRKYERELQEAQLIKSRLEGRPDVLQTLFAPEPQKNYDTMLRDHYGKRPDPYAPEFAQWEWEKDRLLGEKAQSEAESRALQRFQQTSARDHNRRVEESSWEKLKEKASYDEFVQMTNWIGKNIRPDESGRYPEECYNIAFRMLHGDRDLRQAKLDSAKKAGEVISKAKPSGESGLNKQYEKLTPEEEEDQAFIQVVRSRMKQGAP